MSDREEIIKGLECCSHAKCVKKDCPYFHTIAEDTATGYECTTELTRDALELLKENDIELERIHQNIRAYIKDGCSTDTEADKEYVCSQIDRIFEGKPVLLDEEVEQDG